MLPILTCNPNAGLKRYQHVDLDCFTAPQIGEVGIRQAPYLSLPSAVEIDDRDNRLPWSQVCHQDDEIVTSATVYSFRNAPVTDPNPSIAPFCSSSNGWLPLICTMNATNVVPQILDGLGRTVGDIESVLSATAPGADGLTFIPFLNGERTPNLPDARGSLLSISSSNLTPPNLICATIEGVSFGILNGLDLILDCESANRILLIGGGSRSAQWCQLLADASGTEVCVPLEEEAGCLGACIHAIFALRNHIGHPETLIDICNRCIKLDITRTGTPNPTLRSQYVQARAAYKRVLMGLY